MDRKRAFREADMEVKDVMGITGGAEAALSATRAYAQGYRVQGAQPRRERDSDSGAGGGAQGEPQAALLRLAEPVERFMAKVGVEISFHVHEKTGEMQAEVRDASGEKVLRKVPADELLRLAASIREMGEHFLSKAL